MRANRISATAWVLCLCAMWSVCGFVFAALDDCESEPGLDAMAKEAAFVPGHKRILIVGGSNAIVGFDAAQLSARFGRPAVNLALLEEGGDKRIVFEFAKAVARPGDTVILSLRSFTADTSNEDNPSRAWRNDRILQMSLNGRYRSVPITKPLWRLLPAKSMMGSLLEFSGLKHSEVRYTCDGEASVYGTVDKTPRPPGYWKYVAANIAELRRNGVTVLATFPWVYVRPKDESVARNAMQAARRELAAAGVEVIEPDVSADIIRNGALFCDALHLNQAGAAQHMNFFASHLAQLLPH